MTRPTSEVPCAREFMREKVFTLAVGEAIGDAIARLLEHGYSGAPVIDEDRKLVGVLSEWDCVRVLSAAAYEGWPTGPVERHMTTDVEKITPATDLFTVVGMFSAGKHRRFPVVEDGRLIGIVTRRDLLNALHRHARAKSRHESTYEAIEKRRAQ